MVGPGNRDLGRLGPGRNHDQGSEKGKSFLVPRQCVPSAPQPALLVWLLTSLAFKETSSFGGFGGPLLSWFPTSLSGSSFSTPSGALSSLSCPGFGPGLFSRPSLRGPFTPPAAWEAPLGGSQRGSLRSAENRPARCSIQKARSQPLSLCPSVTESCDFGLLYLCQSGHLFPPCRHWPGPGHCHLPPGPRVAAS